MIKFENRLTEIVKKIRHEIFIEEQGFLYDQDEIDNIATHVIYYFENKPIGVCRYFTFKDKNIYHIGRFAIKKEYRNKKHGSKMLELVINQIKKENGKKITISSQLNAINFYKKAGFVEISDIFYEQNCPHKDMLLNLN